MVEKILCIIPARAGSKEIPNKNIKPFCGRPLLAWSIEQARAAAHPMRIIVSTDSADYAAIARAHGAEVPFLRPKEISQDLSIDEELFAHALDWLKEHESYEPDILVHLRATYPTRSVETLNACIQRFLEIKDKYTSLRTVIPTEKTPFKMYRMQPGPAGPVLEPLFRSLEGIHEPFNNCRQVLPPTWTHNCCIDILTPAVVRSGSMSGSAIYPFIMRPDEMLDIDTDTDWATAENITRE